MTLPWLVVVDMQTVFAGPDGPWAVPAYDAAAAAIGRLLPAFAGRTVLTRFVAPADPAGRWRDYYAQWPFALVPADDALWDLTEPFARLEVPVVTATTFGKWGDDLASRIPAGADVVLTGVSTDCCVLSTALAAADAGVGVRVVADACAGVCDDDHARALTAMSLYAPLIQLTSVQQVLAEPSS